MLGLRLVPFGELCGGLSDLGSNVVHSWLSPFRPLLEKLPSPGPTHRLEAIRRRIVMLTF